MRSIKRAFFRLVLLAGVGFSTMYGYNCCSNYCTNPNPLGTGFMIGVYGTFQTVYFNTRDRITELEDGNRAFWRFDSIQKAPGGGGFISYGCPFYDRLVAAIRIDGFGLAESAHYNYRDGTELDDENVTQDINFHEMGLRWAVDLCFQPGILVGNCLLSYFKVGATLGGVREKAWIKNDDVPFDVIDEVTKHHHPGGYVLGAGVNVELVSCFNFFVEYDWRSYTSHLSSLNTISTVDEANYTVDTRITSLHSSAFTFGLAMQF